MIISKTQRRLFIGGFTVLAAILMLSAWKLAAGMWEEAPVVATLADGRAGQFRFTSYTARWFDLPSGAFRQAPVQIVGSLLLPETPSGRVPAAVILHGSDGITALQAQKAEELRSRGMAVLVVDSFGARGVDETVGDQGAVTPYSMLIDAYQALALLQTHPVIDPDRIALIGWSKGGMVADWATRLRYQSHVSPEGRRFAAHVAFYPWCGEQESPLRLTGAPILYLIGANDDWTGAAPCVDYANRIREAGYPVRIELYPDAEHGFDYPGQFRKYLAQADSWANCNYTWQADGLRVIATGELLPWEDYNKYLDQCVTQGAHVGSNAVAKGLATADLWAFLSEALDMR
jgi:dienelactone hydrolase